MANGVNGSDGQLERVAAQAAAGPQPVKQLVISLLDNGKIDVQGQNMDEQTYAHMLVSAGAALHAFFEQQKNGKSHSGLLVVGGNQRLT